LVILPGSKLVIKDLQWLKKTGLFTQLLNRKENKEQNILGICGGYQMMFKNIIDNDAIETTKPTCEKGLAFIDDDIIFKKEKILKQYNNFFEIHHGISKKYPVNYEKDNIKGTFTHGLFNDEKFKIYKNDTINDFIRKMKSRLDIERIIENIKN
jgi:adenosylcobyric acid synthase